MVVVVVVEEYGRYINNTANENALGFDYAKSKILLSSVRQPFQPWHLACTVVKQSFFFWIVFLLLPLPLSSPTLEQVCHGSDA